MRYAASRERDFHKAPKAGSHDHQFRLKLHSAGTAHQGSRMSRSTCSIIMSIILPVFVLLAVFRIGYALQRIETAQVVLRGPVCDVAGAEPQNGTSSCSFEASLAGSLFGGMWISPKTHPNVQFQVKDSELLSYAYTRDAWHMAYFGMYWLPLLLLLILLPPVVRAVRHFRTQ